MTIYYETYHHAPGDNFATITAHTTIEDAFAFAEAHRIRTVYQIGGSYDEFEKCEFCGEWCSHDDLKTSGICWRCDLALYSRGEKW